MKTPDIDNPDLPLDALFCHWPHVSLVFLDRGMLCPGCPIAPFHTVIEACEEYGLDEMAFRTEIRRAASDAT